MNIGHNLTYTSTLSRTNDVFERWKYRFIIRYHSNNENIDKTNEHVAVDGNLVARAIDDLI
jgi:hypothetical protein